MFCYSAYGQEIESDFELPELAGSPGRSNPSGASIAIRHQNLSIDWSAMQPSESMQCTYAVGKTGEVYLSWDNVGAFRVRGGCEIAAEPVQGADFGLLRVIILGSAMAVLLHQQRLIALHGSALEVHGRAAAFIGGKGYGKSTLAATLAGRGHLLLTDDLIAIASNLDSGGQSRREVLPSYSQLKLWPDAAEALGYSPGTLPKVTELYDKVALRSGRPAAGNVPLGCIIVLGLGSEFSITKLPGQAALTQLLVHTYVNRFSARLMAADAPSQLLALAGIAAAAGVYKLTRPAGLDRLNETAEGIERFMDAGSNER